MAEKKRLRRDKRVQQPPRMRLMPRDVEILKAVGDYRILRQDQLQALFFGSKSTTQYRLSHLFQHGFLARHFLPVQAGWSTTLYTLDKRGIEILHQEYGADEVHIKRWDADLSHEFLTHTLAIHNVRIAVTLSCRVLPCHLACWIGEAELKNEYDRVSIRFSNGSLHNISLIPDSYFVLETPTSKTHFFLELDRGTMTTKRFATKVLAYLTYVNGGQYQRRYQTKSLRVLTVVPSEKRLVNLKAATEQANGGRMFWFSTFDAIRPEKILTDAIWQVAGTNGVQPLIPSEHLTK